MIDNPKHIQVELTNSCNLACMECPHRVMKRPMQSMEEEVFQRFISIVEKFEAEQPLGTIILHKDGEPLLCRSFEDYFARIAEKTAAKIDLYTNGYLLTADKVAYMAQSAQRNKIWILISFHNFRYDGFRYDLTKVEENLKACLEVDAPNVEFIISMHKLDLTDEQWTQDFYIKWTNVSIQNPKLKAVHVNTCINHWAGRIEQKQEMANYVACPYMDASHMFIGVSGNVLPCCIDMEEEIIFGNILHDDLSEIMEKREKFYKQHEAREVPHELCSKCLM